MLDVICADSTSPHLGREQPSRALANPEPARRRPDLRCFMALSVSPFSVGWIGVG